jgi:predicted RNase H-like nuclease (RuvC/YqgF family)
MSSQICYACKTFLIHRYSFESDNISFSTKIDYLKSVNTKLREENEAWKEKVTAEARRAKLAEEHNYRLRETSEEELYKMYTSNQQLREQVERYIASMEYFKDMLTKCFQGLGTALPVLEEMKKGYR